MSTVMDRLEREPEASSLCLISRVSWKSIFAGALTAVAIGIVLALLGVALGFTVVDPLDASPFSGVGLTFGIWTLISGVVSLVAGGFVGGMFAGDRGCVHGFLVWALVLLLGVFSTSIAAGMAIQSIGNLVGSGMTAAAEAFSGPASDLVEKGINKMEDAFGEERDMPRIMGILRDTGIEQLQPAYLMGQFGDARRDMTSSLQRLTLDNYDSVIASFLERQKERLEAVKNRRLDHDSAVTGLMRSRSIPRGEAESLLQQALSVYEYRLDQLETGLSQAQRNFEDTREYLKQVSERARQQADEAVAAAAESALMASIALILGAIGSIIGGRFGARHGWHCTRG